MNKGWFVSMEKNRARKLFGDMTGWKIYLNFFLKYLVGFLAILAPCILILLLSWSITNEQVLTSGQLQFEEGVAEISSEISKMRILKTNVDNSKSFQTLAQMSDAIPYGEYMHLYYANEELENMRLFYGFSPYFFVLFENNDIFVSTYQCEEDFFGWYYGGVLEAWQEGEKLSAEVFRQLMLKKEESLYSFKRLDSISYVADKNAEIKNPVVCVINKTHVLYGSSNISMAYVIPEETLVDMLLAEESQEKGFVRIKDAQGNLLLDYNSIDVPDSYERGIVDVGDHWMISAYESEETGWFIQIGISKGEITEQVRSLFLVICVYAMLGLLLVTVLSYIYSKNQFLVLKNFYSIIPERRREPYDGKNKYDVLEKIFSRMAENSECYLEQKNTLEQQNRAILLEKLIVGGIETPEEYEELQKAEIVVSDFYCVVLMRMHMGNPAEHGMMLLAFKEHLNDKWSGTIYHIHSGVYDELFIFSLPMEHDSNVEDIEVLFENAAQVLNEEMQTTIGVGISAIGTTLFNLKRCYMQAYQVLEGHYQEGKNTINRYFAEKDHLGGTIATIDFLNQFYNRVLHLNEDGISKQFLLMKAYYHRTPASSEEEKKTVFYSVRNVLYNSILYFADEPQEWDFLPEYNNLDSIDVIVEKLSMAAEVLLQRVKVKKKGEKDTFENEVLDFIEKNYTNPAMSVGFLCEEMKISERYLQSVIKEKTGDTFAVYLEKCRVKRATELLIYTELSNEQIAEEIGFGAVSTFYRVFNKRMGMSPKAFREG